MEQELGPVLNRNGFKGVTVTETKIIGSAFQKGSENQTSSVPIWSKRGWMPNGPL